MTTPSADDLRAFRDFEQSGWNGTADKYDQWFGGLTPYFREHLLDSAQVAVSLETPQSRRVGRGVH